MDFLTKHPFACFSLFMAGLAIGLTAGLIIGWRLAFQTL